MDIAVKERESCRHSKGGKGLQVGKNNHPQGCVESFKEDCGVSMESQLYFRNDLTLVKADHRRWCQVHTASVLSLQRSIIPSNSPGKKYQRLQQQ